MPTESQLISIETPDGAMPARLWWPPTRTGPGLVLVQEIFGVSRYIQQWAADLAALGYVVCVPQVYWRLGADAVEEDQPDALDQAMRLAGQVDWDRAVSDVAQAVSHLRGLIEVTSGVGLVGFCFGGGLAFNVAAVEPVEALVSYYGSSLPDLLGLAGQVRAPSLYHHGLSDTYLPPDTVERIRQAVTRDGVRFETYPGADHAFDNPAPQFHHAEASAQAWAITARFLGEHLPSR